MLGRYTTVWKLYAASGLAAEGPIVPLASLGNPVVRASVTCDPEPNFFHIDRANALGTQLLKGVFTPQDEGSPEARFEAEVKNLKERRAEKTRKGVFLVVEGELSVHPPEGAKRSLLDFDFAIDAIDKEAVRCLFRPFLEASLAALGLCLEKDLDRHVEKIGDVVYLDDQEAGRPLYSFTLSFNTGRASISSNLTAEQISLAGRQVGNLLRDGALSRTISLMQTSLDRSNNGLQAFIAAWSALEVFVNATFKASYENLWFEVMGANAPNAAKPVLERFKDVMSDKYRLADKFLVIASILDPSSAKPDAEEFRRLTRIRDSLLHALETPPELPREAVQKLLFKYIRLHLGQS